MDLLILKKIDKIFAKWKSKKDVVDNIQAIKTEIEDFKYEAERAEREGITESSREIRYGKIKKPKNV
jgi:ATP-dependent Clp protease ATP-binding subunit ClpB